MSEHWKTSYLWRNNASNVLPTFWTLEAGKSENIWNLYTCTFQSQKSSETNESERALLLQAFPIGICGVYP